MNDNYYQIYAKTNYASDESRQGHLSRFVSPIINIAQKCHCKTALDYGCGRGWLSRELTKKGLPCDGYDPYSGFTDIKSQYDMVISTDVLEHLTLDELIEAAEHIKSLKPKVMFHSVFHKKAKLILPDGTNAHKTIENPEWWKNKLNELFEHKVVSAEPYNEAPVTIYTML